MTAPQTQSADFNVLVRPGGPPDDETRCALCGDPLQDRPSEGCVRGACATRPQPDQFYAVRRLCREYDEMILATGIVHRFYAVDTPELSPSTTSARRGPAS